MIKKLISLWIVCLPMLLFAQTGYVIYKNIENGNPSKWSNIVVFENGLAQLNPESKAKEKSYVDYKNKQTIQIVQQNDGTFLGIKTDFKDNASAKFEDSNEKILGYSTKKVTYVVNSNKIEVFYNEDLPIKATPSFRQLPQIGTILKVITNGNRTMEAVEIKQGKYKNLEIDLPKNITYVNDDAAFMKAVIESRYTTISIFENDTIHFTDKYAKVFPSEKNKLYHYSNGNILLKKIQFPVLKEDDALFITVTQKSNGDAYDRTGVVFAVPVNEGNLLMKAFEKNDLKVLPSFKANNGKDYRGMINLKDFKVPYELMRFFTPFGVGAYNNRLKIEGYDWPDSASYTQDISDLKTALSGKEMYLMMSINNYDAGGHVVSLDMKIFPESDNKNAASGNANFHKMLFNTTNFAESMGQGLGDMFGNDSLRVNFTLDKPLKNAFLRYTSTGWGGWGNGDEFLPKVNDIFLNEKKVFSFVPWRTDCVTYRNLNPVSGNFSNGLSSSDLSRSNWCPGTTTNPIFIPLGNLQPGNYSLKVAIPMGEPEGNSYSGWNVSGLLEGVE